MTTHGQRRSATIYDFAERARAILAARAQDSSATDLLSASMIPSASYGSGWYHEAAIRETDRTRKP